MTTTIALTDLRSAVNAAGRHGIIRCAPAGAEPVDYWVMTFGTVTARLRADGAENDVRLPFADHPETEWLATHRADGTEITPEAEAEPEVSFVSIGDVFPSTPAAAEAVGVGGIFSTYSGNRTKYYRVERLPRGSVLANGNEYSGWPDNAIVTEVDVHGIPNGGSENFPIIPELSSTVCVLGPDIIAEAPAPAELPENVDIMAAVVAAGVGGEIKRAGVRYTVGKDSVGTSSETWTLYGPLSP